MGMGFPSGVPKQFWNEIEVMATQYCEYNECN